MCAASRFTPHKSWSERGAASQRQLMRLLGFVQACILTYLHQTEVYPRSSFHPVRLFNTLSYTTEGTNQPLFTYVADALKEAWKQWGGVGGDSSALLRISACLIRVNDPSQRLDFEFVGLHQGDSEETMAVDDVQASQCLRRIRTAVNRIADKDGLTLAVRFQVCTNAAAPGDTHHDDSFANQSPNLSRIITPIGTLANAHGRLSITLVNYTS